MTMQKEQDREFSPAAIRRLSASVRIVFWFALLAGAVGRQGTAAAGTDTNGINPIWLAGGTAGGVAYSSLILSQDGQFLATGNGYKFQVWRTSDRSLVRDFNAQVQFGRIGFSSDGNEVVGQAPPFNAGPVQVWRRSDGGVLHTITAESNFTAMALSPDGGSLAFASGNLVLPVGSIRLRNVTDGALFRTLRGHSNTVNWIAFSEHGTLLASGSNDKTVRLWQVSDGALLKPFAGHAGPVYTVRISPDNRYLASESSDATVKVWSIP